MEQIKFNSIYLISNLPWNFSIGYIRKNNLLELENLVIWPEAGILRDPLSQEVINKYMLGYKWFKGLNQISFGVDIQETQVSFFELTNESVWALSISSHINRKLNNNLDQISFGISMNNIFEFKSSKVLGIKYMDVFYNQSFLEGLVDVGIARRLINKDTSGINFNSNILGNQSIEIEFLLNSISTFNFRMVGEGQILLGTNVKIPILFSNDKFKIWKFRLMFGNNKLAISKWNGNGSYFSFLTGFQFDFFD